MTGKFPNQERRGGEKKGIGSGPEDLEKLTDAKMTLYVSSSFGEIWVKFVGILMTIFL